MACYFDPTSTLKWDVLIPYIQAWVLGCPDELITQQARLATIELCRRSGILHDQNTFNIQAGVDDYFLTTLCDYQIIRVFKVTALDRWEYKPAITQQLTRSRLGPYSFWMDGVDVVHLSRPFSTIDNVQTQPQLIENGLRVEFIVAPKQDGCILDNYLYQSWAEGIAFGAISKILMIPNSKWYNPKQADIFAGKFRNEIARARTANDLNFTSGSAEMQMRRWV